MFEIATVVVVLGVFAVFGFTAYKAEKAVVAKAKSAQEARAKSGSETKSKAGAKTRKK